MRVRSMLAHGKLSKMFWVEALITTTYAINKSPSTLFAGDVPQRVWTGKDVSYRHLKVFYCLAYVHVAMEKRGELDLKTRPNIPRIWRRWVWLPVMEPGRKESDPEERHSLHGREDYHWLGIREEDNILRVDIVLRVDQQRSVGRNQKLDAIWRTGRTGQIRTRNLWRIKIDDSVQRNRYEMCMCMWEIE